MQDRKISRRAFDCRPIPSLTDQLQGPTILILVDGWTQSVFQNCLDSGLLPEIRHELIDRGVFIPKVVSIFPSVSLSSHTTILTGVNQNRHGIPGHRWMSTDSGLVRNYIGLRVRKVNEDINANVETVFERMKNNDSHAVQSNIYRGAKHTHRLFTLDSQKILSRVAKLAIDSPNSFIMVWLPNGDAVSHTYGPDSNEFIHEMIKTSKGIGMLTARLRKAGVFGNSKIIFTSDHGQKSVRFPVNLATPFIKMGCSSAVNPRNPLRKDIAIFTSGDSAAYIYFCRKLFPPDRKYHILGKLRFQRGVGLIFYRYSDTIHYVLSRFGISKMCVGTNGKINYDITEESDPLDINSNSGGSHFEIDLSSPSAVDGKYPDIVHQYLTSFVANRSSDVLVTSDNDYHFGLTPRIGFRLGYHRGSHGGPSRDEMIFSAIITGVAPGTTISNLIRSKDLLNFWI